MQNTMSNKLIKYTADASVVWKSLNGVFAVYKPASISPAAVRNTIKRNLCKELNEMHVRPPSQYVTVEGDTTKQMSIHVQENFADNPLVCGPRYIEEDVRLSWARKENRDVCGLFIGGLNRGNYTVNKMKQSQLTKKYRLRGLLGQATNNHFITGKIIEKSTYHFVRRHNIDRICASMQSSHQKTMFETCGVNIQSQAAYELAVRGPLRPADQKVQMVYSIKCIHFIPPEFIIEIACINEDEMFLKSLIHIIGMALHTTATCTQVQCFEYGPFSLKQALLSKHWTLQNIVNNISECKNIISKNSYVINQLSPHLIKPNLDTDDNTNVSTNVHVNTEVNNKLMT